MVLQEACAQPEVTIFHLDGHLSSCRKTQRYIYMYSLRRSKDSALKAALLFLTASPLSLHPLPSLISNHLNLPLGTQEEKGDR